MKRIVLTVLAGLLATAFICGQKAIGRQNEKIARELGRFESDWLAADLNGDGSWLARFADGKMFVIPSPADQMLKNRWRKIADALDSAMPNGSTAEREIKVRITGNITILGQSAAQRGENSTVGNRAYYFLDTFNKRGGKWEIIASHLSPVVQQPAAENAEQIVRRLEGELSAAKVKKDVAELNRITADDFSGIDSSGRIIDKAELVNNIQSGNQDSQTITPQDLKVKVFANTAIVTKSVSELAQKDVGKSDARVLFTDVWAKTNERWQLVNSQATRLR